ncbi:hypothetical protein SEVIR_3G173400v4 [Setaria viridis]|uniref:Uncharacterized protein n=2 Tax=Setaria TaxID=4554 RepID=K3ZDB3_SETIT|nr:hypothetical protein SETIT_3G169200v2 [Setaria italica]TKW26226.1 hypothetical protein SEVIR_3G173400v2 [Setaria viridis]
MGSRDGTSGKASLRLVSACLALCLLLSRCSPCEGRKLLPADEEGGKKVMHVEGDLVLRVPPASPITGNSGGSVVVEEPPAVAPRGFSAGGRAARLMRSVPSPGVGH